MGARNVTRLVLNPEFRTGRQTDCRREIGLTIERRGLEAMALASGDGCIEAADSRNDVLTFAAEQPASEVELVEVELERRRRRVGHDQSSLRVPVRLLNSVMSSSQSATKWRMPSQKR